MPKSISENSYSTNVDDLEYSSGAISSPTQSSKSYPKTKSRKDNKISRSLSFQSAHLAQLPFPDYANLNHMMINIIMYTSVLPKSSVIISFIDDQMMHFLRFRSIPICSRWLNYWKPVKVNIDNHLFFHSQPNNISLHQLLEEIMQRGYCFEKPRWEIHVIENLEIRDLKYNPSSRNAILFRVDHSVTDGLSLVKAFKSFLTDHSGKPLQNKENNGLYRNSLTYYNILENFYNSNFIDKLLKIYKALVYMLITIISTIRAIFAAFYQIFGQFDDDCPITPPYTTKIKDGLRAPKYIKLVQAPPINLHYVKELKDRAHCTLNDVLISAFAGGINRYFEYCKTSQDQKSPKLIRALLPYAFVSNPSVYSHEIKALRNRWTFISVNLQVDNSDPITRLSETHKSIESIKHGNQPFVNAVIYNFLGRYLLTNSLTRKATLSLFNRHSIVFSSLPTYSTTSYFCGSPIQELYVALVGVLPQVEIITYADKLHFSLVVDSELVVNANMIPFFFLEELAELGKKLGLDSMKLTE